MSFFIRYFYLANPQKENGYVPIANEIIEALARIKFTDEERRCLLCVIRKTYGFNKKSDQISLTQFQEFTGLSRRQVVRALNSLGTRAVLARDRGDTSRITSYVFEKNYEKWKARDAGDTRPRDKSGKLLGTRATHTKDNYKRHIKDTLVLSAQKTPPNPSVKIFIDWWYEEWLDRFNVKYTVTAKDGAQIGRAHV